MKIVLSVIEKKLIHQLYSKYNMTVLIQKREMVDTQCHLVKTLSRQPLAEQGI